MRPSPRSLVSLPLLLAGISLAGCFGKNQPPAPAFDALPARIDLDLPENDELEGLPEAGDTGWIEGQDHN
jgi:hypothetical protein